MSFILLLNENRKFEWFSLRALDFYVATSRQRCHRANSVPVTVCVCCIAMICLPPCHKQMIINLRVFRLLCAAYRLSLIRFPLSIIFYLLYLHANELWSTANSAKYSQLILNKERTSSIKTWEIISSCVGNKQVKHCQESFLEDDQKQLYKNNIRLVWVVFFN